MNNARKIKGYVEKEIYITPIDAINLIYDTLIGNGYIQKEGDSYYVIVHEEHEPYHKQRIPITKNKYEILCKIHDIRNYIRTLN